MWGRRLSRWVMPGLLALAALPFAGSAAAASSGTATRPVATYGPAREWGGTRVRSLDPAPSFPVASAASAQAHAASVAGSQILSNESTFTQWAYVASRGRVYATPSVWSH